MTLTDAALDEVRLTQAILEEDPAAFVVIAGSSTATPAEQVSALRTLLGLAVQNSPAPAAMLALLRFAAADMVDDR